MNLRGALLLGLLAGNLSAEPPRAVRELQEHLRDLIAAAEPGVAAIVVSTNPAYAPLPANELARPGTLGDYRAAGRRTDGIVPEQPDPLDLSDPRNAADNHFGSGLVLDRDGRVLTTYHLIDQARKIFIRYADGSGTYADIHAADARSDLAVLRPISPPPPQQPLKFGTVRLEDGDQPATVFRGLFVLALAHPLAAGFNDGKCSAGWGMIANIRRRSGIAPAEESRKSYLHSYSSLLQTDARINLGSSGGAILNLQGEVIGLISATAAVAGSEAAGGYAIPTDPIFQRIIKVLKEGREVEYGFLGVSPDGMRPGGGLVIRAVTPSMPAQDANLMSGDELLAVDDRRIRELEDLFLLVSGSLAGTEIKLLVQRAGQRFERKVRLAKFAHDLPSIASVRPDAVFGLRVDYSSIVAQQRVFVGEVRRYNRGVIIRELEPGSPAEEKLKPLLGARDWLITKVNGQPVQDPAAFYEAVRDQPSVTLTLQPALQTGERERTVTLP